MATNFLLVPSNATNILNENFTLVSELSETSEFNKIKNALHVFDMEEGDVKSAIYVLNTDDYIKDACQFIKDLDMELDKDFHRIEYIYGNKKININEFRELLHTAECEDPIEKQILQIVGISSCLGLPVIITNQGFEPELQLAEMSSAVKKTYPMRTSIKYDEKEKKWDICVSKTVRCCTVDAPGKSPFENKENREEKEHEVYGTSYGICTLEIVRHAKEANKVYIYIDVLRVPPVYGESHSLLDIRPSIYFSH